MRLRLALVWVMLAVLIGAIVMIEWRERQPGTEVEEDEHAAHSGARMLLPAPIEELAAIEIAYAGGIHRFERDTAGAWFYHGAHAGADTAHGHSTDPVLAAKIANALAGLGRARREREIALNGGDGAQYGLTSGQMIVLVYAAREGQPLAQYVIGDVTADGIGRYVRKLGQPSAVTIANYQVENLIGLLATVGANTTAGAPLAPTQ